MYMLVPGKWGTATIHTFATRTSYFAPPASRASFGSQSWLLFVRFVVYCDFRSRVRLATCSGLLFLETELDSISCAGSCQHRDRLSMLIQQSATDSIYVYYRVVRFITDYVIEGYIFALFDRHHQSTNFFLNPLLPTC
jgi:hypothetical protein